MSRLLLLLAVLALALPAKAAAQAHSLAASATVLAPVRAVAGGELSLSAAGGMLEVGAGRDARHIVTVSVAPVAAGVGEAGGRVLVRDAEGRVGTEAARRGVRVTGPVLFGQGPGGEPGRLDLGEIAASGSTHLEVTYRIAADV